MPDTAAMHPLDPQPPVLPAGRARRTRHALVIGALVIGACTGLALPMSAQAQKPPNISPGEMALIPPYCPDTMGFNYGDATTNTSPRAGYWLGLMGRGFWAVHHYCWGLIKLRRADRIGMLPVERIGTLTNVVGEFNYVLENSPPDFVLLPEVLTQRGDVLIRLGDAGAAIESYQAALQRKADYWPAYVSWGEVLLKIGRRKEAQELLERGLRLTPNVAQLRAAYKTAGGDPEAFVRKLPPPAPAAAATAAPMPAGPTASEPAGAVPAVPATAPAASATR